MVTTLCDSDEYICDSGDYMGVTLVTTGAPLSGDYMGRYSRQPGDNFAEDSQCQEQPVASSRLLWGPGQEEELLYCDSCG